VQSYVHRLRADSLILYVRSKDVMSLEASWRSSRLHRAEGFPVCGGEPLVYPHISHWSKDLLAQD